MKKIPNTLVIKIGSSLLVDEQGEIRSRWLRSLAKDMHDYCSNRKVLIVTSGAVGLGKKHIKYTKQRLTLEEKQAAAACGQPILMRAYQECFGRYNHSTAQVLLSLDDSENRRRYLNTQNTLKSLLDSGIIPIVNENDTVATEELRYGDNDRLSARVASMISAELLILLSDIDGLYTKNPALDKYARHVPVVKEITPEIEAMAGGSASTVGSGGMVTKIVAAQIATQSGCETIIASGIKSNPLRQIIEGAAHTRFLAKLSPIRAKKLWIASHLNIRGSITVDKGAEAALKKGNSLLPAGVVLAEGDFDRGDAIMIKSQSGQEIGRGLAAYSMSETRKIMGRNSKEIEKLLGFFGRVELIHRDNMVISH